MPLSRRSRSETLRLDVEVSADLPSNEAILKQHVGLGGRPMRPICGTD